MKILLVIFFFHSSMTCAKEIQYEGSVIFKNKTNIPHVSIETTSKTFEKLSAVFSEDLNAVNKIEVSMDTSTLKAALYLKNHQLYQRDISGLKKSKDIASFKMLMEKIECLKQGENLKCTGKADFLVGKAGFSKKLSFLFDKKRNTDISFVVSKKAIALPSPEYMGIKFEDNVLVIMKVRKKEIL